MYWLVFYRKRFLVSDVCNHKTFFFKDGRLRWRCQIHHLIEFLLVLWHCKCHGGSSIGQLSGKSQNSSVVWVEWVRYSFNSPNPLLFILHHIWSFTFPLGNPTLKTFDEKTDTKHSYNDLK